MITFVNQYAAPTPTRTNPDPQIQLEEAEGELTNERCDSPIVEPADAIELTTQDHITVSDDTPGAFKDAPAAFQGAPDASSGGGSRLTLITRVRSPDRRSNIVLTLTLTHNLPSQGCHLMVAPQKGSALRLKGDQRRSVAAAHIRRELPSATSVATS